MRKLATIRKVADIKPIKDADAIELAVIDGWQCVVKKGSVKKEDLVFYAEIDSFLPVKPEFEFLRKGCFKTMADGSAGFRLRTVRLRGELSQGLVMPLKDVGLDGAGITLGQDITDLLGIKIYEPPIPAEIFGDVVGALPTFIKKTDEERIQNLLDYFDKYRDVEFEVSEKLDGTSMTVFYHNGRIGVCGRRYEFKEEGNNSLWKAAKRGLTEDLMNLKLNIAVQGELIGEGLEGNHYKIKGQLFKVFNVWDIESQCYWDSKIRRAAFTDTHHVPIIHERLKIFEGRDINTVLDFAKGMSVLNPNQKREGFVFKSCEKIGPEIVSFKVINNDYL